MSKHRIESYQFLAYLAFLLLYLHFDEFFFQLFPLSGLSQLLTSSGYYKLPESEQISTRRAKLMVSFSSTEGAMLASWDLVVTEQTLSSKTAHYCNFLKVLTKNILLNFQLNKPQFCFNLEYSSFKDLKSSILLHIFKILQN